MRWLRVGFYWILLLPMICFAKSLDNKIATQTFVMGTPEQATIDGGVINTPDSKKETILPHSFDISDEFSHDENIKSLLSNAAKDGKLAYVLQRAEQLKLPATVALIPMVESHYQTNAVSPKGAKGAWQLMPETAKEYGLKSDARNNFMKSTDAALHLLDKLHQQFSNWTLAFAAYNAGNICIKDALAHRPTVQKIDDLNLPLETKQYIRRLRSIYQMLIHENF